MIKLSVLAFGILASFSANSFAGPGSTGGGHPLAIKFKDVALKLEDYLSRVNQASTPSFPAIPATSFGRLVNLTKLQVVQAPLYENGSEVAAKNFPGANPPVVKINEAKMKEYSSRFEVSLLVAHEYLSILHSLLSESPTPIAHTICDTSAGPMMGCVDHQEGPDVYNTSSALGEFLAKDPTFSNWSCTVVCAWISQSDPTIYSSEPAVWSDNLTVGGNTPAEAFNGVTDSCNADLAARTPPAPKSLKEALNPPPRPSDRNRKVCRSEQ